MKYLRTSTVNPMILLSAACLVIFFFNVLYISKRIKALQLPVKSSPLGWVDLKHCYSTFYSSCTLNMPLTLNPGTEGSEHTDCKDSAATLVQVSTSQKVHVLYLYLFHWSLWRSRNGERMHLNVKMLYNHGFVFLVNGKVFVNRKREKKFSWKGNAS